MSGSERGQELSQGRISVRLADASDLRPIDDLIRTGYQHRAASDLEPTRLDDLDYL